MFDPMLQPVNPRLKFTLNFDPGVVSGVAPGADPGADLETWRLTIPAKPACYLLRDAHEQPILLATTGNLRNALMSRLAEGVNPRDATDDDTASSSKKTDYRAITRIIQYRPCCSAFETDWTFLENVRTIHPRDYRTLIRHWRTHWITLDPGPRNQYPRFAVDTKLNFEGHCIGPIAASADARQTIDALEDLCDLCRHHDILVQAPRGIACAYKEMGKCPAPCDGSITMNAYRQQINDAVILLTPGSNTPGSKAAMPGSPGSNSG